MIRSSDACGHTITLESVPIALASDSAASALTGMGAGLSACRFYRRPPRGWRRHVRRLKAAGQTVPPLGPRRWSQRAAKRKCRRTIERIAAAMREQIQKDMLLWNKKTISGAV